MSECSAIKNCICCNGVLFCDHFTNFSVCWLSITFIYITRMWWYCLHPLIRAMILSPRNGLATFAFMLPTYLWSFCFSFDVAGHHSLAFWHNRFVITHHNHVSQAFVSWQVMPLKLRRAATLVARIACTVLMFLYQIGPYLTLQPLVSKLSLQTEKGKWEKHMLMATIINYGHVFL